MYLSRTETLVEMPNMGPLQAGVSTQDEALASETPPAAPSSALDSCLVAATIFARACDRKGFGEQGAPATMLNPSNTYHVCASVRYPFANYLGLLGLCPSHLCCTAGQQRGAL